MNGYQVDDTKYLLLKQNEVISVLDFFSKELHKVIFGPQVYFVWRLGFMQLWVCLLVFLLIRGI